MQVYFFIIFLLYYFFILLMLYGWHSVRIEKETTENYGDVISLIIAVRNEEKNIPRLLDCLSRQTLSKDQFEVIFVNDASTDNTESLILDFISKEKLNVILLNNDSVSINELTPKKSALKKGIEASTGSVIAVTDGDCRFGNDWLKSVRKAFYEDNVMFVSGPVVIESNEKLLSKIQTIEFSSLIGTGAAMIGLNYPLMCNGANLAFRKTAFERVDGYKGSEEQASGDDVFVMQKIHLAFPGSVKFLKSQEAVVITDGQAGIGDLINQRKRWASKWNSYLLKGSSLLPVFLVIHYISFLILLGLLAYDFTGYGQIGILLLLKIFLDYIFLKKVMNFCKLQFKFFVFLGSELLYPFYALFIGISVHFGSYSWKGRVYKK